MADGAYPAIDLNALGETVQITVDVLLLPHLRGVIDQLLTNPNNFSGDEEDIIGTIYAFEDLISRLAT
ncbi:hypothetical protein ANRL2_00648 [Anaerolineae bacterium]|nr:hypothetical protein ANRL2_00648 [Anaerolineae bacterium]